MATMFKTGGSALSGLGSSVGGGLNAGINQLLDQLGIQKSKDTYNQLLQNTGLDEGTNKILAHLGSMGPQYFLQGLKAIEGQPVLQEGEDATFSQRLGSPKNQYQQEQQRNKIIQHYTPQLEVLESGLENLKTAKEALQSGKVSLFPGVSKLNDEALKLLNEPTQRFIGAGKELLTLETQRQSKGLGRLTEGARKAIETAKIGPHASKEENLRRIEQKEKEYNESINNIYKNYPWLKKNNTLEASPEQENPIQQYLKKGYEYKKIDGKSYLVHPEIKEKIELEEVA